MSVIVTAVSARTESGDDYLIAVPGDIKQEEVEDFFRWWLGDESEYVEDFQMYRMVDISHDWRDKGGSQ